MKDKNIRKISKTGEYSYYVTIPREFIAELKWRKGQKVTVKKFGNKLVVQDWSK